jgi:hypothetical protein
VLEDRRVQSRNGVSVAQLHEIEHPEWPYWVPIRHAFGIRAFGINSWRKATGETIIPEHDESESGHEELYLVVDGHATFTVGGEEIDAPKETAVFISDPSLKRTAVSRAEGTHVLSIGGWANRAFEASEWEAKYCENVPTVADKPAAE